MKSVEVNFDGLVGPTHNYAGLSEGNVASLSNANNSSNPKKAALQGLKKISKTTFWRRFQILQNLANKIKYESQKDCIISFNN